jgi:hypothetical protein
MGMQRNFEFFRDFQLKTPPVDAPSKIVRQIETPRMAMRTTLKAQGMKLLSVATQLHISEGYLSKLVNEKEPMPEWFAEAFCWVTGNNLLRQHIAFNEALDERRDRADWIERKLAAELRSAA